MSSTINLNNEVDVTVIEEIGNTRIITQFKKYSDYESYLIFSGGGDLKDDDIMMKSKD